MKISAVVFLAGIASVAIGAGALWVNMPPLGYDWAPPAITDWQRIRTAKALVRREFSDPDSVEFQNMRISDKTLFGIKKKGFDADEANFFAVCGEAKDRKSSAGLEEFRQVVIHFDKPGGRGRAFIEPEASEMPGMAELFDSAMRPCR